MATKTILVNFDDAQARIRAAALDRIIQNIGSGMSPNAGLAALLAQLQALQAAAAGAGAGAGAAGAAAGRASGGFLGLAGSIGKVIVAGAGLSLLTAGLSGLSGGLMDAADKAALITGRLGTVTKSSQELAEAQDAVRSIAAATRSDLSAVTSLYADMARNAGNLGATVAQVGQATKIFAMTLKISGADANAAAGAIRQLGQAIGSGKLGGDEFASIAEANSVFMQMLADSMGVARGDLKKLASEGKITGEEIKKALTDPKIVEEIEKKFGKIPVTFADIRTAIGNMMIDIAGSIKTGLGIEDSMTVLIAKVNQFAKSAQPTFVKIGQSIRTAFDALAPTISAIMGAVGGAIMFVVNNMDALVRAAKAATVVWLAFKAASTASSIMATVSQVIALERALGATTVVSALFSASMKLVQGAINGVTTALLANPFTFLITAVTAAVALIYQFRDSIMLGGGTVASLGDLFRALFEYVNPAIAAVSSAFQSFGNWLDKTFTSVFGSIWSTIKPFFANFDFSLAGVMRLAAKVTDGLVSFFVGSWNVIKAVWDAFPAFFKYVIGSAVNGAATLIGNFINTVIDGLNLMIDAANAVGGSFARIGQFKAPQIAVSAPTVDIAGEYARGKFTGGHDSVEGLLGRADQIGRARQKQAAAKPTVESASSSKPTTPSAVVDKDKDKKAKDKLAEIQKKYDEFYTSLTEQAKVAAMLPADAERYNKELELRKILGDGDLNKARQLNTEEKQKIKNLLDQKALNEINRDLTLAIADANSRKLRLDEQEQLIGKLTGTQLEDALALEEKRAVWKQKLVAAGLTAGDAEYTRQMGVLETLEKQNLARERALKLARETTAAAMDYAKGAVSTDGTAAERRALAKTTYDKQLADLHSIIGKVTPAEFRAGVAKASREFKETMAEIGSDFERKMRTVGDIFDRISRALGNGKLGEVFGRLSGVADSIGGFGKTKDDVAGKLQSLFGSKTSPAIKSLSEGVGKAVAGLEIGTQIGGAMEAFGLKGSGTGAKIGGALGGLTGNPLIAAGASIIGGLIGNLFYKPKHSNASFGTDADGNVTVGGVVGSNSKLRAAASGAAGEVLNGLQSVAEAIGGKLTGTPNLTIGTWDNKWRVLDNQRTTKSLHSNNFKSGLHDFGDDQAAAVAYAIGLALKQGVITGLSDLAQKALNTLDSDSAIGFIQQWGEYMKDMNSIIDPIGSAIKDVTTSLDSFRQQMVDLGASTADLTKLDEYRALKLKEIADEQLSQLRDFQKSLSGQGSGVTELSRLTSSLAEFNAFKTDIAAGKTIDQSKFTSLGSEIMNLASSLYGTSTTQFQDIRKMLIDATAGAVNNVQNTIDAANIAAIDRQTDAITARQDEQTAAMQEQNELLAEIRDALQAGTYASNDNKIIAALRGSQV